MKQKLESELISIAHRILKLKNKGELDQLHNETRVLYEKLSILKFVEENFEGPKPTIGRYDIESKIDALSVIQQQAQAQNINDSTAVELQQSSKHEEEPILESSDVTPDTAAESEVEEASTAENLEEENPSAEIPSEGVSEEEQVEVSDGNELNEQPSSETEDLSDENSENSEADAYELAVADSKKFDPIFKPTFEWSHDEKSDEVQKEDKVANSGQIAFEDLLGSSYVDPVFVKPEELETERRNIAVKLNLNQAQSPERLQSNEEIAHKAVSLNDRLSKGITVGLNDRIGFVKHLFNNSTEDYNRVLSQLITFDSFAEAKEFIDQMVKPDYNDWTGKDEYATRFMEVVEKKFS